jgi:hypothetical protein
MQVTFERVARSAADALANTAPVTGPVEAPVQPPPSGLAWSRARRLRDQAMHASDDAERLDGAGAIRPGRPAERPGTSELDSPSISPDRASQPAPRLVGPDIGG